MASSLLNISSSMKLRRESAAVVEIASDELSRDLSRVVTLLWTARRARRSWCRKESRSARKVQFGPELAVRSKSASAAALIGSCCAQVAAAANVDIKSRSNFIGSKTL